MTDFDFVALAAGVIIVGYALSKRVLVRIIAEAGALVLATALLQMYWPPGVMILWLGVLLLIIMSVIVHWQPAKREHDVRS
jgi:hypothetical protein